ncbi:MAG: MlaD family protein [Acidocella sp.]|nr:MlaD family protein [Acidocella sp.]
MSASDAPPATPPPAPPRAQLRRRRFSFVWLIPLVAALIAGYLGYRTLLQQGPLLTLTFDTAEGLAAGQTQVQYKAVALGTVESIDLSRDNSHVVVKVRMNNVGKRFLTSHARYWVVRPRFTPGDLSGLTTLVSGAFIAVDPGAPGGDYQTHFAGLEEPPGVRSNEPGRTYVLKAYHLGTLGTGSPVFYRDVQVGEVLGYDLGNGLGPVTVSIFVRAPFDNLVKPASHFWNSSGISASLQNGRFHIEFQSLQAIISGGVTFNLPPEADHDAASLNDAVFPLYNSEDEAEAAGYQNNVQIVSYFTSSVAGLTRGAPVNILGIQVGQVTNVRLIMDPKTGAAKVRVAMDLQPERVLAAATIAKAGVSPLDVLQNMINQGDRIELGTSSFITGQKDIAFVKVPKAPKATITHEGDALVLPSSGTGLDSVIANISDISAKLDKLPIAQIGDNVNKLLVTTNKTVASAQVKQTLEQLNATLRTANTTLSGVNQNYGEDSDFQHNLEQLMNEANATLRAIRLLTDELQRDPQSLLLGRSGH